jgi:hypothetical protein
MAFSKRGDNVTVAPATGNAVASDTTIPAIEAVAGGAFLEGTVMTSSIVGLRLCPKTPPATRQIKPALKRATLRFIERNRGE